jgi:hypothetical protein
MFLRMRWFWQKGRIAIVGALLACAVMASNLLFTQRAVPPTMGADSSTLSAVLVALGGCRGMISEVLWWRIADLQRQNRYAELVPLTDLLVTLDPASADTWVYNAWNLSYNISAAHQDAAEKWYWVKEGIHLLERGLRVAPRSEAILRQLGWIFEDKVGGQLDTATPYYRAHLSELSLPADAALFAKVVGLSPDWHEPMTWALYWYWRASHARDMLRVTLVLVGHRGNLAWVPFLLKMSREAWDDLAPRQHDQVIHLLQQVAELHPLRAEIERFLKECAP